MLEIGRVVDARGQHHHRRVGLVGGRGVAQRPQQMRRVVVDRAHPVGGEQIGEHARHGAPVLHDIGHTRGRTQVVLEDPPGALLIADQIDAGDVDSHTVGRDDAHRLPVEMLAGSDQAARDDAVVQYFLVAVDVVEIHLERLDPLGDAALQTRPLGGRDNPRHQVQRKWPLLARQREGDPLVEEGAAQRFGASLQLRGVRRSELGVNTPIRTADRALGIEHLVERHLVGVRRPVVSTENALRARSAKTPLGLVKLVRKTHCSDAASSRRSAAPVFPFWEKT